MKSARNFSAKEQWDTSVPVVVIAPGYHGHGIARSLGRLGIAMYGVHADPRSPAARSKYWRKNFIWNITKASAEDTVNFLLQIAREIGTHPILIPTDDSSCIFVADHAATLRTEYLIPNQPDGLARSLSSKEKMYYLCKKHAIPTPETSFPHSREDVIEFLKDATFPIMLKGIDTLALYHKKGTKMVLVEDAENLLKYYDILETPEEPNVMLQEYIPGGSEQVWMFDGYFDNASDCLFGIVGKKIRQYPAYTGVTSLGVCVDNPEVETQTRNFMKALGYRGVLDLGYKYDSRTGEYKLLDVNPRVGTTFRLFVDSNEMDVVRTLYRDLTNQSVLTGKAVQGRKWLVENFDLISSVTYYRDGKVGLWGWLRSFRGVQERSWFAWDDLRPFFAMWGRSVGIFFEHRSDKKKLELGHAKAQTPVQEPPVNGPLAENQESKAYVTIGTEETKRA